MLTATMDRQSISIKNKVCCKQHRCNIQARFKLYKLVIVLIPLPVNFNVTQELYNYSESCLSEHVLFVRVFCDPAA